MVNSIPPYMVYRLDNNVMKLEEVVKIVRQACGDTCIVTGANIIPKLELVVQYINIKLPKIYIRRRNIYLK